MAYNTSRRARERRLRARYRKRVWTAAIVMLIIGLVVGFVVCVYAAKNNDRMAEILNLQERPSETATATLEAEPTPDPMAAEPTFEADALGAEPTLAIVEMTQSPVSAETQAPESGEDTPAMAAFLEQVQADVEANEAAATEAPAIVPAAIETVEPEAGSVDAQALATSPEATQSPVEAPEATQIIEEATAEPTAEPTAAPTPEPTPENIVEPVFVPYGQAQTFQTQILTDGKARQEVSDAPYETLDITMQVKAYKDTAYFEANYAEDYNLQGNEAAVEFEITLNNYTGTTQIIPQNFLLITFTGSQEGVTSQGFQLMDSEIAGKTDIAITSNQPTTLYKRYPYNPDQGDMTYMVVNTYVDGVQYAYCFEIQPPEGEAGASEETASTGSGESLTVGSKGDEVKKLQRVLIDNKLLSGEPDGHFGNYTAEAVKEMQRRFDMEPTGVADQAFLDRLYAESDS